jgi:hypothetical protein
MPRALHAAFETTIERIQNQDPEMAQQGMNVLTWTFLANRQLTIEELRHALAVEPDDTNLDWDNFVDTHLLLESCLGLVVVDECTGTVRLVHKSLQDYLQMQYNHHLPFENGHNEISNISSHICCAIIIIPKLRNGKNTS